MPQEALPAGAAYESFIGETGKVPTRENLHDFFNALVWLSFPRTKCALNQIQAAEIDRHGVSGRRGPARDAATLFDENGAILVVSDSDSGKALVSALRERRWVEALYERRGCFGTDAKVFAFGHALLEKLIKPYKSITAHVWVETAPPEFFWHEEDWQHEWVDENVAKAWQDTYPRSLSTERFTPLPILGVPGWWSSQSAEFYLDPEVFRPPRN